MVHPNGYWELYQYDSLGRLTNTVAQVGNTATNAAENVSRVTSYTFPFRAAIHRQPLTHELAHCSEWRDKSGYHCYYECLAFLSPLPAVNSYSHAQQTSGNMRICGTVEH